MSDFDSYADNLSKAELRGEAERLRASLDLIGLEGDYAAKKFLEFFKPQPTQSVALYYPMRRELETFPLMESLHVAGVPVLLPIIATETRMLGFYPWTPQTQMLSGPFGVMQPVHTTPAIIPDILVVPLLAFDRRGNRLGYGGGYYDHTITTLRHRHAITAVGYAYDQQMCLFPLPRDPHDVPLDYVVTPQSVHDFTHRK